MFSALAIICKPLMAIISFISGDPCFIADIVAVVPATIAMIRFLGKCSSCTSPNASLVSA